MVRELKNHPGFFLEDAAAADLDKLEDRHGLFRVTSARRSEAEQQGLIDRWDRGGAGNRPPWLYEPYRPARNGPHVKRGGIAVDIGDWKRFMSVMGEGNFTHPYDWDDVHFEHNGNRDTLLNLVKKETEKIKNKLKEQKMFYAVLGNWSGPNSWWLIIPQTGREKPYRAIILGANAIKGGDLPVISFEWDASINALKNATEGI